MSFDKATFALAGHNPDVLTCIANLSNDEVFTPPEFANRMLDTLEMAWAGSNGGASIWSDPTVTFLDPFTKSGVFLREITRRLSTGLAEQIPDLRERVDHILTKQVFGIGITTLTSLLARRSLYCSKKADAPHSVAYSFERDWGNIWFERSEHTWAGEKCAYCGAGKSEYSRSPDLETHAYAFIHASDIKARITQMFGVTMQFDVIIGNPPYQLGDGGFGTSAAPIYQLFVDQAKALEPRYLSLVIPSRWFAGGKGLDDFRLSMLGDKRVRSLDDFLSAADVFPGVGLKGGICFFLWDRDHPGLCTVTTHFEGLSPAPVTRSLLQEGADIFIRFNEALPILRKVLERETGQSVSLRLPDASKFSGLVSSRKPFGLETTFRGRSERAPGDVKVYQNGGVGYVNREDIRMSTDLIDAWKLFVGRAAPGTGNKDTYPHRIISTPFLGEPGEISAETYLAIGPFLSQSEAQSAMSYLSCRLTRLLILLHKPSQDTTKRVYTFVPTQTWDREWTDADLYEKYGITDEEIAFIESMVRPMEAADA